jgi:hypothetical protein
MSPHQETQPETIGDLLRRIDAAVVRMSAKNDHRRLLEHCRQALIHLANQLPESS